MSVLDEAGRGLGVGHVSERCAATTHSAVMPRLDRGIQYGAASPLDHNRLGVLDRPVKPGDDTVGVGTPRAKLRATVSLCDAFPVRLKFRNDSRTNRGRIADSPLSPVPFSQHVAGLALVVH